MIFVSGSTTDTRTRTTPVPPSAQQVDHGLASNLTLLCRAHHHALHDDEFGIDPLGNGRFRFHRADGRQLPEQVDASRLTSTTSKIEDEHRDVAAGAATTRWDGTRLDRHYAIAAIAEGLHSTRQRSA